MHRNQVIFTVALLDLLDSLVQVQALPAGSGRRVGCPQRIARGVAVVGELGGQLVSESTLVRLHTCTCVMGDERADISRPAGCA